MTSILNYSKWLMQQSHLYHPALDPTKKEGTNSEQFYLEKYIEYLSKSKFDNEIISDCAKLILKINPSEKLGTRGLGLYDKETAKYIIQIVDEIVSKIEVKPFEKTIPTLGSRAIGPIEIPFFNNLKMKVLYEDIELEHEAEFIKEADEALKSFLEKTEKDRLAISHLVHKNCMDFLDCIVVDEYFETFRRIKDHDKIWNYVHPKSIVFTRSQDNDQEIYLTIFCNCDWEQEHGLQIVLEQGIGITRIS